MANHLMAALRGQDLTWLLESEVYTSDGWMDSVVKTASHIYIFEFKINQTAAVALAQIRDKDYADKYALENKTIVKVGINFNTKRRTIDDWAVA